jgi:GT2 family glycosyltransferase/glycosyltransferase involved in cell wall biosynthesis
MTGRTPELSAIVVSWNSSASLASSLSALRRSAERAGVALEIVIVDNASSDDSVEVARSCGVDLVVANPLNAGYVVAASQGIAVSRGEWLMLANPDLVVADEFVASMMAVARTAPGDVACLVPDIRYAADPTIVNSRGIAVDTIGIPAENDAGREVDELTGPTDVFGVSTSGCIIRRSALAAVGGLEPLYFAYLEDVDVSWRLRKQGQRVLVVPGAVALHEGSASTGEGSWLKSFLVARNRRALFRLHGPAGLSVRPVRMVTEVGHATVQALSGSGTASVRGRFAAIGTRRYTRYLQASNRVIGIPDDTRVDLAPRQTLHDQLRRKRSAESLMHRADGRRPSSGASRRQRTPSSVEDRRVKVLVDATNLKPGQGGIRTYTIGLIEGLAAQPELELVVAASIDDVADLGPLTLVKVPTQTQRMANRARWREQNLASLARSLDVDAVLSPVPELPLRRLPVPSVIVVHDVGPLVAPAFYSLPKRLRYQSVLPRACNLATAVVCVSHATLLGLHSATGIDPQRCVVIGEAPQLLGQHTDVSPPGEPYFLYVGSLEARKNVQTLVDAVLGAEPPLPARLVVVGPLDGRPTPLSRRLTESSHGDRVEHLGFVSPARLTDLYRGATAVVLPSVYEGYGLPVLEAMTQNAAVVATDIPSVREIAGDAALYVDRPFDAASWQSALRRIAEEDELRADLVRRGASLAEGHSWPDVGRRFAELLVRVVASNAATRRRRPPRA